MSRRAITQEFYQALLRAYREAPGNARLAARTVGCDPRTARKAWKVGWPELGDMRAISDVVEEETVGARAKLAAQAQEALRIEQMNREASTQERELSARDKAKEDAVNSRAQEAQAVRLARGNAMGLMVVTNRLLQGASKLAEKVQSALQDGDIPVYDGVKIVNRIAAVVRMGNEAAQMAIQMERTLLGEPNQILGIQVPELSPQEYANHIQAASRAAERAARLGLVVLPGGLPADAQVVEIGTPGVAPSNGHGAAQA